MEDPFLPPCLRLRESIQSTPSVSAAVLRRTVKLTSVKNKTCHRYSTIGTIVGKIVKNRLRPCSSGGWRKFKYDASSETSTLRRGAVQVTLCVKHHGNWISTVRSVIRKIM